MSETQPTVIRLWAGKAPGALGDAEKDTPTITAFPANPAKVTGAAIVVCPGGGYAKLAPHEGRDYALWLNELGIAAFVLKYRLAPDGYRHPCMLQDAARAVRTVRARAAEWNVDHGRVGIMGSSAGGHLASTLLTHADAGDPNASDPVDRQGSRPDLGILCYPVITFGRFAHSGSRKNLLGDKPSQDLLDLLSNEKQVDNRTPPTFLWHTVEDPVVPVENSILFAQALRESGVPFALHLFERGRHGLGLANGHPWTQNLTLWLKERGFISG